MNDTRDADIPSFITGITREVTSLPFRHCAGFCQNVVVSCALKKPSPGLCAVSGLLGRDGANAIYRFIMIFAIAALGIVLRRWEQFIHPGVWVEDGSAVLPSFVEHGWAGLFLPVQGYLVVPCKIVSYTALQLSFNQYALISTVLATAVQAACVGAVACAPTVLPARRMLALAVVLLPTGPEAFGLPIFVLWWTTLLIFLALFWRADTSQWPRIASLMIGALSSPMIILLLPLFILRAAIERRRSHIFATGWAIALATIQAAVILREQARQVSPFSALTQPDLLISKYLGTALYGLDMNGAALLGCIMIAVLVGGLFTLPTSERFSYLLLGLCLGCAILSSVARVPVDAPHPIFAGPRYFFYPITCILWMLVWITARSRRRPAALVAAAFIGAYVPLLARALPFRDQVPVLAWPKQVKACARADTYTFQLEFAGWKTTLRGEDCRRLIRQSLFD